MLGLSGLLVGFVLGLTGAATPQTGAADTGPGQSQGASAISETSAGLGIDLSALDRKTRPCDDFYRFACGNWIDRTEIPADRPRWSRTSEIQERNQKALQSILETAAGNKNASATERQLGDFYTACMDETRIEKTAAAELSALLKPIDAIRNLDDLAREVARQHLSLGEPFFQFSSQQDYKDATQVIGNLDQGGLGLPDRDYYLKTDPKSEELRTQYVQHIARLLTLGGTAPATAETQARSIFAIEKQLATASLSLPQRRDPKTLYHRLELEGTLKLAPRFPWQLYLHSLGFPGISSINVAVPDFVSALNQLLGEQSLENLKLYLRWNALNGASRRLSQAFVNENFDFYGKRLTGAVQNLPRWKRCVSATDQSLGEALAVAFVAQNFGADGKAQTQEIITYIEQAMAEVIKNLAWMDDSTRRAALGKLNRIVNKIGYPDKARDYSSIRVRRDSYLQNFLAAGAFESKRTLAKIGKPLDRSEWQMTAPTVNAYYEPLLNEIVFPAGILQPPLFSRGVSRVINFGSIGMIMGHEVTHGFDDEGRQFDLAGNLKDWWSPKVSAEFDRRASCIVEQYNGFTPVDNLHLDGKLTLGENIADLGGIKLAFAAYQLANKKNSVTAPKSEFNQEQLFFLGLAQSWCEKRRPEYARMLITVDPHSPGEYRINGPLANFPAFAAAWQCKAGDKMVRQNQCSVW